jgi:hypothetical protein
MAPPKVGALSAAVRKQAKMTKETLSGLGGSWSFDFSAIGNNSQILPFHHGWNDAPPINVPTNGKYPLSIALVPAGVSSEEDMLGKIASLKNYGP